MGTWKPDVSWGLTGALKALAGNPEPEHSGALWGSRALEARLSLAGVWRGGPESSGELSGRRVSQCPGAVILKQGPQKPSVWCMVINGYASPMRNKGETVSPGRQLCLLQTQQWLPSTSSLPLGPADGRSEARRGPFRAEAMPSLLPPCNPSSPTRTRGSPLHSHPQEEQHLRSLARNEMLRHAPVEF